MKTQVLSNFARALLLGALFCTTGCVYTYYDLWNQPGIEYDRWQSEGEKDGVCLDMTYRRTVAGKTVEVPLGSGPLYDWIYFTVPDECYALRRCTNWNFHNLSFCGVTIHEDYKWPLPFLWRIDLRKGRRELIAWLDDGKVVWSDEH